MTGTNPYDELPYRAVPVEWSAPERLAVASLLHGGPGPTIDGCNVLELGCGCGANLLPLAHFRPHASFVGVDGACSAIELADSRRAALGLENLRFVRADFSELTDQLGDFDFIIAHGVFSWVDPNSRQALLRTCSERLRPEGLVYLNYNAKPGWNVRGMVRDYLLANTAGIDGLARRARRAIEVSAAMAASLQASDRPYSALLAEEFGLVRDGDLSYVAHEYLATHNHAYWRSEFLEMAATWSLEYVADADFNYPSGRIAEDIETELIRAEFVGSSLADTVDMLSYRQLHSPILRRPAAPLRQPVASPLAGLRAASRLARLDGGCDEHVLFEHPSGVRVEAKDAGIAAALDALHECWPSSLKLDEIFPDTPDRVPDLRLLHRHGLIELRCVDPAFDIDAGPLHAIEEPAGYRTDASHVVNTLCGR